MEKMMGDKDQKILKRGSEQRGNDNAACIYTFLKVKGKTFFYKTMIILQNIMYLVYNVYVLSKFILDKYS